VELIFGQGDDNLKEKVLEPHQERRELQGLVGYLEDNLERMEVRDGEIMELRERMRG